MPVGRSGGALASAHSAAGMNHSKNNVRMTVIRCMDRQAHLSTLRVLDWIMAALLFVLAALFILLWCVPGLLAIRDGHPIGWLFLIGGLVAAGLTGGLALLHVKAGSAVVA